MRCDMRMTIARTFLTLLLAALATPISLHAWDRGKVERFATLPPGEAYPEGIDTDREGNVYVVTVGANKPDTSSGGLFVFDPSGKYLRTVHTEGTSPWLLDLRFQPNTGKLLVVRLQKPEGLRRRSQDGRFLRVHDRYGRAPRPRRLDL
jgi:sugar lactone lactonase YvrE